MTTLVGIALHMVWMLLLIVFTAMAYAYFIWGFMGGMRGIRRLFRLRDKKEIDKEFEDREWKRITK